MTIERVSALSLLLGRPLMIEQAELEVLIAVASRGEFFEEARVRALAARDGQPLRNARTTTTRGSTAVIPVVGPLVRHADMFTEVSGLTSYATLRKDFQAALDDSAIRDILFEFDSPGGEVTACNEMALAIYEARGKGKRIIAYVDGLCCSAALYLAAACDEIIVSATARVGSIGVIWAWLDDRAAMAAAGVREIKFVSSQSPNKNPDPATDAGRAQYQQIVDDLAAVFYADVAKFRGVSEAHALERFGKGAFYVAARAVEMGLADRISNLEAVLTDLATKQKETTMTYAKMVGLAEDAGDDKVRARVAQLAEFEARVLDTTGAKQHSEAIARVAAGAEAVRDLAGVREQLAKEAASGIKRDLRAALEAGLSAQTLDLGRIQKGIALVLRGETKAAWQKAMAAIPADKVARATVLDAAASVAISAEDLEAISEYARTSAPVAAQPHNEPPRDPAGEHQELDETAQTIKAAADEARRVMDRNKTAPAGK